MEPPITHVTWLKEGEPTRDVNLRYKVQRKPDSSSLVFKSVDANDKGRYACEITTKGYPPIKSEFAMLSIREKLKFSPEPVDRKLELNSTARVIIDNHKNEKLYKKSIIYMTNKKCSFFRYLAKLKAFQHPNLSGTKKVLQNYQNTYRIKMEPYISTVY